MALRHFGSATGIRLGANAIQGARDLDETQEKAAAVSVRFSRANQRVAAVVWPSRSDFFLQSCCLQSSVVHDARFVYPPCKSLSGGRRAGRPSNDLSMSS